MNLTGWVEYQKQNPVSPELEKKRGQSLSRFSSLGLPGRNLEAWRYTPLKGFAEREWKFTTTGVPKQNPSLGFGVPEFSFFNGRSLSSLQLQKVAELQELNSLDALMLSQPEHFYQLEAPPVCVLRYDSSPGTLAQSHLKIAVRQSTQIFVLLEGEGFSNQGLQIDLAQGCGLDLVLVQAQAEKSFARARIEIDLKSGSKCNSWSLQWGAQTGRVEQQVRLLQEGCRTQLRGLSLAKGTQNLDQQVGIQHQVGGCESDQFFKAVGAGSSRTVISGQVNIHQNAQKAQSQQLNRNILLSPSAEVVSLPRLLIDADDVTATHGSSTGALSEDELFYFLSRGIRPEMARRMLLRGFGLEALQGLPEIFAPTLHAWVEKEIGGML